VRGIPVAVLLLCRAAAWAGPAPAGLTVGVTILDQAHQAVPGVRVQLKVGEDVVASAQTDQKGRAEFTELKPAHYELTAAKEGFEPAGKPDLDLSEAGSISIELTLVPSLARRDSIEVKGTAVPVEQGAPSLNPLPVETARQLPNRPATVADALPLIPGVVREPGGGLRISGGAEHRSALIVNSADVTDPATGQFGLTVPIDSVESLNVFQTPFLAEYGRFTSGLVTVETRRGGDRWKWELNDPLPEFRIRSYHLRGLKDATPRLNFEGPLVPGKLYLSEGFEYEVRKTAVYTLPFPNNQKKQKGINSFAQLDWIAGSKQLVTATVHAAPQRLGFANMNYFNPRPTTPDASTHNYTATAADRLTLWGGLLENTFSVTRFDARVWGQGPDDLTITPGGNRGNYFALEDRSASRTSGATTYSFAPLTKAGAHHLKAGADFAGSSDEGQADNRPVNVLDSAGRQIQRITYGEGRPFQTSDFEYAFFAQDHWIVSPRLALDVGLRTVSQQVSEALRLAPRAGVAWSPFPDRGTVLRAGFGWFYDRVPLNVYSFHLYPDPTITWYGADGQISAGPFLYVNTLGRALRKFHLVFAEPADGNFSPRSAMWTVQVEQPLTRFLQLRASYMENDSDGLVLLYPVPPDPATDVGARLLSGAGQSRYRQFEATARMRLAGERHLFFSYMHSRARGDLNDFGAFLGTFPVPIVRDNQFGNLPADLPNRFLTWGMVALPWTFRIAPVLEYRSGFPYTVTDAAQNYVGAPNQTRFPNFLSVDSRISKDFKVTPKYSVRLSVSGFNLTNHFNPEAVHANVADPVYGFFFGHRGRRFTADFDVLY
jgi:hypothetical protein